MAKQTGKNGKNGTAYDKSSGPKAPEGFTPLSSKGGLPWVMFKAGVVVQGYVKGRFPIRNKKSGKIEHYFQIKLTGKNGVPVIQNKKEATAKAGDIVNLREKKAFEVIKPLAESDGQYEVWCNIIGKEDIGNGQTFWNADIEHKVIKASTRHIPTPELDDDSGDTGSQADSASEDDIPF